MELLHHPQEIEAWLDEIRGVLDALRVRQAPPSGGQLIWLSAQTRLASEAIDALDHHFIVAEEAGWPVDDIQWLHTRVCAVAEALTGSSAEPAAAA